MNRFIFSERHGSEFTAMCVRNIDTLLAAGEGKPTANSSYIAGLKLLRAYYARKETKR